MEKQDPGTGTTVQEGSTVTLTVHSNFVDFREVPDVTGLSLVEAKQAIERAGMAPAPSLLGAAPTAGQSGRVAAQRPGGGTRAKPGGTVEIDLYGEYVPPRAAVPDVRGMTLAEAQNALRNAGFGFEPSLLGAAPSAQQAQKVNAQSPAPGTSVAPGTTVRVDVWGEYAPPAQHKGGIICFTRWSPQSNGYSLYCISPDGANERKIAERAHNPRLSYDGRMIVYRTGGTTDSPLEICGVDGTGKRRPISGAGFFSSPAWMADGRGIYLNYAPRTSGDVPDWRLGWVNVDGSGFGQAPFSGGSYLPAPDGARAAFLGHVPGGAACIFITQMGMAGNSGRQVTYSPGDSHGVEGVSWSPDSSTLAFVRYRYGGTGTSLCTVPSQGGAMRVVVPDIKSRLKTAWSPDMKHILIIRTIPGRYKDQLAFVNVADGSIEPFAAAGVGILDMDWR